MYMNILDAYTL